MNKGITATISSYIVLASLTAFFQLAFLAGKLDGSFNPGWDIIFVPSYCFFVFLFIVHMFAVVDFFREN